MKNGLYTRIYKKAFVFVVVLLMFGIAFGLASLNFHKIKADTNFYEDISPYVVNDWENYTNYSSGGVYLTNNGDGTLQCYGTASTVVDLVLPLTKTTVDSSKYYGFYIACAYNNTVNANLINTNLRFYLAYNNGANITSNYCYCGTGSGTQNTQVLGTLTGLCIVARFSQNFNISQSDAITITPFLYLREYDTNIYQNIQSLISVYAINSALGPQPTIIDPADLTKVNYIASAEQTSLVISSQINMTFGNQLQNLIQYSFEAGDTIIVDNAGETALYIDLLTMAAGNDSYIMRFNNDAQSNDYLSVYLYKNNNYVYLYNDNTGEITAGNIEAFRTWGVDAINNGATITGGSQFNNNIINKIFVYSTGTNYETGYTNGYRDGYDAGEAIGFEEGTENGYFLGYGEGYDQGATDGLDTSWLVNLFQAVNTFFDITILPGIKIGTIFAIPFVLSVAWVIIRILRGGGYGD